MNTITKCPFNEAKNLTPGSSILDKPKSFVVILLGSLSHPHPPSAKLNLQSPTKKPCQLEAVLVGGCRDHSRQSILNCRQFWGSSPSSSSSSSTFLLLSLTISSSPQEKPCRLGAVLVGGCRDDSRQPTMICRHSFRLSLLLHILSLMISSPPQKRFVG